MARSRLTFKERDVARLVKAAAGAGLQVRAVRVDPHTGVIEVVTSEEVRQGSTPLDEWIAKHARSA
jgi:hypothetical protein